MRHIPLDFMGHEIEMEVGNWRDLNLMGHDIIFISVIEG